MGQRYRLDDGTTGVWETEPDWWDGLAKPDEWVNVDDAGRQARWSGIYEVAEVVPNAHGYLAFALDDSVTIERNGRLDREVQAEAKAWCDAKVEAVWPGAREGGA